jgi:hypothetical protein
MDDAVSDPLQGAAMGSMFGPWGAAAGAGAGLIKYFAFDKPANDRKRALAAATEKFSPWTGLHGEVPDQINPMSSAMSGAGAGMATAQNLQAAQGNQALQQSQIDLNKARTQSMQAPGTQTGFAMQPYSAKMGQDAMGPYMQPDEESPWLNYKARSMAGFGSTE